MQKTKAIKQTIVFLEARKNSLVPRNMDYLAVVKAWEATTNIIDTLKILKMEHTPPNVRRVEGVIGYLRRSGVQVRKHDRIKKNVFKFTRAKPVYCEACCKRTKR